MELLLALVSLFTEWGKVCDHDNLFLSCVFLLDQSIVKHGRLLGQVGWCLSGWRFNGITSHGHHSHHTDNQSSEPRRSVGVGLTLICALRPWSRSQAGQDGGQNSDTARNTLPAFSEGKFLMCTRKEQGFLSGKLVWKMGR